MLEREGLAKAHCEYRFKTKKEKKNKKSAPSYRYLRIIASTARICIFDVY